MGRARAPKTEGTMQHIRHISATLSDDAWQITDARGQHTARVTGTQQDAVALAQHQLAA